MTAVSASLARLGLLRDVLGDVPASGVCASRDDENASGSDARITHVSDLRERIGRLRFRDRFAQPPGRDICGPFATLYELARIDARVVSWAGRVELGEPARQGRTVKQRLRRRGARDDRERTLPIVNARARSNDARSHMKPFRRSPLRRSSLRPR